MKRQTKSGGGFGLWKIALTTIVTVLFFAAFTAIASAATIYVPDNFSTIQQAVDNATAGDTIIVRDGTYTENVNVNKRLTIRSENGSASTTVQASNSNDHVFEVTADYVNISGFTATGATGCPKTGIYLNNVDYCKISENNCSNNRYGIFLDYSSNYNTLTSNTASNNNWDGIRLYSSSYNTLSGNFAYLNNWDGIYLGYSSNNNKLSDNSASNNSHGIYLGYSSNNNNLSNNSAYNNTYGIYLSSSSNNEVTGNTANSNNEDGIALRSSSNNNTLTSNTASYNYYGIYLSSSSNNNTLTSNTASNNSHGIYLSSSSNNNLIYNNYFNSTNNAWDNGNNIWNTTKTAGTNIIGGPYLGGNYWSDYAGVDNDGDGLGDTMRPYNSSGNITLGGDWHPLVLTGPVFNCTCGDICVNETGWWRDGGAFKASNTPIQHAIENATAGDTICVQDGTYNENVEVTKSHLTICSENGPSVTTVSASLYPNEHVFDITDQTNVTLKGFEIRDARGTSQDVAGIYMYNACGCNISGNIVTNISTTSGYNANGIYLESSSDNSFYTSTVYNLDADSRANGIYLRFSSGNSFDTSTVYNLSSANLEASGIWLASSSDNSFDSSTVYNLSSNIGAYGIWLYHSSGNSFHTSTVYNISAYYYAYGIYLRSSSDDNSFSSGSISDINAPSWWDFYSRDGAHRNSAENITISSIATTISFTYDSRIGLKSVATPPADPADRQNIGKYVNVTDVTADSWIFMNVSYEDGDLGGVVENSLRMWKHNGTDWTLVPGTNGVNTAENYVYANITEFSVFAPLGNVTGVNLEINKTDNPDPVSPGGTLNYTLSVNNTGNATATNVTVKETYDGNVTFVTAVPAPSLGNDTWVFATLNVSETRWINISVTVNASVLNGTVLHNIVNVSCNERVADYDVEDTTVFSDAVHITSFAPPSPVNDTVCNWRTFNVTVNQTVNVSWYLNNTLQQTNGSVREARCRLHADAAGVHNVTAIASNANGSDMQTWIWNVTKASDLVITGKWLCWPENCTICYNVTNIGNGTAHACHNTALYVDGVEVAYDRVPVDLETGKSYIGCFADYSWKYTPPSDNITVCADNNETVDELDEDNNCLTNIWRCGDVNGDGKVTMSDVRKVFNRYFDPNYPLYLPWAADVNGDGKVSMSDVRKVFNRYLDPGYELDCCCMGQ